jgi:hypothetical protein
MPKGLKSDRKQAMLSVYNVPTAVPVSRRSRIAEMRDENAVEHNYVWTNT